MRWLLAAATLIAVALAAALVLKARRTPAVVAPVAQRPCADASARPLPPLPEVSAAPLQLLLAPNVHLLIDGAAPGSSLSEGPHQLEASAPGNKAAKVQLTVDAFTPLLLDVRASFGAVTVLVVGARCGSCAGAVTNLEFGYRPQAQGELSRVAKALSEGDWLEGAQQLQGIAPSDREPPEVIRLLAVLSAFAGRPTLAREQLERLDDPPLQAALAQRDALEELKPVRQLQTATARWNATTERFQRVTDRFVAEAPGPLTALTTTFGKLSREFADAREQQDAIGGEAALDSANAALTEVVMQLRALHPDDCAWQRQVSEAL